MPRIGNPKLAIKAVNGVEQDITDKVIRFEIRDSLLTGKLFWSMDIFANNLSEYTTLATNALPFLCNLSINYDGKTFASDWRILSVRSSNLYYKGGMPVYHLEGSDDSSEMMRVQRFSSYIELPVNFILEQITSRNNLGLRAVPIAEIDTWYQCGETDWDFLQRVLDDVTSLDGNRNLWFYLDVGELVVEPIDYTSLPIRQFGLGTGDDRVESAQFYYFGRDVDEIGGDMATYTGFDPLTKQYLEFTPDDAVFPVVASGLPNFFGFTQTNHLTSERSIAKLRKKALKKWMEISAKRFGVHLQIFGDPSLKIRSLIDIVAATGSIENCAFNGKYPIYEIAHILIGRDDVEAPLPVRAGLTTHIVGYRRTYHDVTIPSRAINQNTNVRTDFYNPNVPIQDNPVRRQVKNLASRR